MQYESTNMLNKKPRRKGLTVDGVRLWGAFFTLSGIISRAILQNGLLNVANLSGEQLLAVLDSSPEMMAVASVALVLQFAGYCAVPGFALLAAEGFAKTSDVKRYLLRVAAVAVISELPYNLVSGGTLWDPSSRNPAFGVLLALLVLYLLKNFADTNSKGRNRLFTAFILLMGVLWSVMLQIECGLALVLTTAALYIFRHNTVWQLLWGTAACCLQFPAPMGLLCLYAYNGKQGSWSRRLVYAWYPVTLLAAGLAGLALRLL